MSWGEPGFETLARSITASTGISLPEGRAESIEIAIRRAMLRAGVHTPADYCRIIEANSQAFDDLVGELTVGETYFFRDPDQFAFIREHILPEIQQRRGSDHSVRIWSSACATGEEAYSLAILCLELGLAARTQILATDLSRAALAKARCARYGSWSLRGTGASMAKAYLSSHGNHFSLCDAVQMLVRFEYLNLAIDQYPSFAIGVWGFDLLLCRNVLIYLATDVVQRIGRRLYDALAPGGWLLTSATDPLLTETAPFETEVVPCGVVYRRPVFEALSIDQWRERATEPDLTVTHAYSPIDHVSASWAVPKEVLSADATRAPNVAARNIVRDKPEHQDMRVRAHRAYHDGENAPAAKSMCDGAADAAGCSLFIRELANSDVAQAELACCAAVDRFPLSTELRHLHAVLLAERGRSKQAEHVAQQLVYLDRTLAIGHYTLGAMRLRNGDCDGARRSFRNAHKLCAARPPAEPVPLADGEPAGRLAEAVAVQIALIDASERILQ